MGSGGWSRWAPAWCSAPTESSCRRRSAAWRETSTGSPSACRRRSAASYHEAWGSRVIVLRPCGIGDSRLGINRDGSPARGGIGWVCRHDLAEACHLALENAAIDFDIMHTASHPDADGHCNVARSRDLLGLEYRGHFPGE